MSSKLPDGSFVLLFKQFGTRVTRVQVGVIASLSASPTEKPSFAYPESQPSLVLAEPGISQFKSAEDLQLACELAVANAIMAVQEAEGGRVAYLITALEGQNLNDDCTVGFAIAATLAAKRASPLGPGPKVELCGWEESGNYWSGGPPTQGQ